MLATACKKDAKIAPSISITGVWHLDYDKSTYYEDGKVVDEKAYGYPETFTMIFNDDKTGKFIISDFNYTLKGDIIHFIYSDYEVDGVIASKTDKDMVITFDHFSNSNKGSETGYRLTEHLYK